MASPLQKSIRSITPDAVVLRRPHFFHSLLHNIAVYGGAVLIARSRKKKTRGPGLLGRLLALLPASCALFYPLYCAQQLTVDRQTYVSAALPAPFSGLTITYLSDIHYGTFFSEDRVRNLVKTVNDLGSDLILLGGDYGETSQGALDFWALHPCFSAPMGVFAVAGNHDRTPPERNLRLLRESMKADGVTPLINDVTCLKRGDATLALAGVDDFYNGHPNLKHVIKECATAGFTIFLPHTPDILPECAAFEGFFDLALCGHTHGGQVAIGGRPLLSSSRYGNRYVQGWLRESGGDVFISPGVGVSGLPVRLGTRAQIHQITLYTAVNP